MHIRKLQLTYITSLILLKCKYLEGDNWIYEFLKNIGRKRWRVKWGQSKGNSREKKGKSWPLVSKGDSSIGDILNQLFFKRNKMLTYRDTNNYEIWFIISQFHWHKWHHQKKLSIHGEKKLKIKTTITCLYIPNPIFTPYTQP